MVILFISFPAFTAGSGGDDSLNNKKNTTSKPENKEILPVEVAKATKEYALEKNKVSEKIDSEKLIVIACLSIVFAIFLAIMVFILFLSNRKAQQLNEQLAKKRNESEEKNEEIKQQKEEIEAINNTLEQMVLQRTQELKLTVDSLSQRNKDLEQFSYIVSHNLRAPIARLIGLANIFDYASPSNPANQEILTHTKNSAQSLDEIVKDLTYILGIRNDSNLRKEHIDLEKTTQAVLKNMDSVVKEVNPQITFDFSEGQYIFSERSYIENILFQLISNAIKYRKRREDLKIHITTQLQGDKLQLCVKDNGMGINLTNINPYKIFGLYQRMHTHTEGKGLGLYLVKTQIEALGGDVGVESVENVGSAFSIFLPYVASNQ